MRMGLNMFMLDILDKLPVNGTAGGIWFCGGGGMKAGSMPAALGIPKSYVVGQPLFGTPRFNIGPLMNSTPFPVVGEALKKAEGDDSWLAIMLADRGEFSRDAVLVVSPCMDFVIEF